MGFDRVEFAGLNQERDDGPVLCARIMIREKCGFAVQGDGTNGAFDRIVIELNAAIAKEPAQPIEVPLDL